MEKRFLLGVNEKSILIGEIEITTRNGYKEFTASFDKGEAFDVDDLDLQELCQEDWDCLDEKAKLDLLYDGDRTREDVFDEWTRYSDYHEFIDCSCTDIEIETKNGELINFETVSGGQHDERDENNFENFKYTNKRAFELIMYLWDNYHLKEITEKEEKLFDEACELLKDFKPYSKTSENFIKENLEF